MDQFLAEAYESAQRGRVEPDIIWTTPATYLYLRGWRKKGRYWVRKDGMRRRTRKLALKVEGL